MGQLPFERIKREVLVKREIDTSKEYGIEPSKRKVEDLIKYGIINVNKPAGPTSHQVSDTIQKILKIKKSGHSGTLDPSVTGVLPVALDKATRIVQTLLPAGKEYVCLMHLHKEISEEDIKKTVKKFLGKIKQLPPIRSAIKRQIREREVYSFEILEIDRRDVLFKIDCAAGTYIRKICSDFGNELKIGAHMGQLIRTKAGPFNSENMFTLHDLKDAYTMYEQGDEKEIRKIVLPFENAINHLPKIWVVDGAIGSICHGSPLYVVGIAKYESNIERDDLVAVLSLKGELVCVGKCEMNSKEMGKKEKGTAVNKIKVFMERNVYPKKI
jgi:H/ACA ribonucleoprotein complex subunit 4